MTHLYQKPRENRLLATSMVLGLLVALILFLLVPLTQMWQTPTKSMTTVEELVMAEVPPPPPPRDPPPPKQTSEDTSPPKLETPPPMPSLEQLELSLSPGTGGDLSIADGVSLNLSFETESVSTLLERYGFEDLDEVPHVTRFGRIRYPAQLQRRKVEGYVQLLVFIDPSGRVEVQEVLSYSHKDFIEPAKAGAAATRFSPPMRGGQAVSAKYSWRIEFSMDR
jgi:TonB family protein